MINRNIVNTTLAINKLPYVYSFQSAIPAGTVTLFQQTTAPVGWTKLTVHDNKALRLIQERQDQADQLHLLLYLLIRPLLLQQRH